MSRNGHETERSITNSDLKTCPICEQRDRMKIRFSDTGGLPTESATHIGCARCNKWFDDEGQFGSVAAQKWNLFAIEGLRERGHLVKHRTFYKLVYRVIRARAYLHRMESQVDAYLQRNFTKGCPLRPGGRFRATQYPRGVWSARKIRAIYDYEQGPFWIIDATNVTRTGHLGDTKWQFRQTDADSLRPLAPFWQPTRWNQVIEGDQCIVGGQIGKIVMVNQRAHNVIVRVGQSEIAFGTLQTIRVPVNRFED